MLQTLAQITASPDAVPPRTAGDALLDAAGCVAGAHVVVLGPDALPVLCGLIRRGAAAATESQLGDRVAEPAEIVIVPGVASPADAARAVDSARRALLPCGVVVIHGADRGLAPEIMSLLQASGFSTIRARPDGDGTVVTAERPMFGPLTRSAGRA
jgi:hypothetical protein